MGIIGTCEEAKRRTKAKGGINGVNVIFINIGSVFIGRRSANYHTTGQSSQE